LRQRAMHNRPVRIAMRLCLEYSYG